MIIFSLQGNESYTGIAARDTASALRVLTSAVRGVAAATEDKNAQRDIIKAAQAVIAESAKLVEEAKAALNNPGHPGNQRKLAQVIGCDIRPFPVIFIFYSPSIFILWMRACARLRYRCGESCLSVGR